MELESYTPVNIVVGRFQPLTNGHIKCINDTFKNTGLTTILIIVNTDETRISTYNPFPTEMLIDMYMNICMSHPHIEGFVITSNADIVKNTEKLKEYGYIAAAWTCGEDRYDSYKKMVQNYYEKSFITNDFTLYCIPRNKNDISATSVRNDILNNNYNNFINKTPFNILPKKMGRRYFNIMHEQISKINKK